MFARGLDLKLHYQAYNLQISYTSSPLDAKFKIEVGTIFEVGGLRDRSCGCGWAAVSLETFSSKSSSSRHLFGGFGSWKEASHMMVCLLAFVVV